MFIESKNVKVFPSAFRGAVGDEETVTFNPESRLFSEFNITHLITRLATADSFVVDIQSSTESNLQAGDVVLCSIHGYWFEIKLTAEMLTTLGNGSLYAVIELKQLNTASDPNNQEYPAWTLINQKETTSPDLDTLDNTIHVFGGIQFLSTLPSVMTNKYSLKILEKMNSKVIVPASSKLKFKTGVIEDIDLDGTDSGKPIKDQFSSKKIYSEDVDTNTIKADSINIQSFDSTGSGISYSGGNVSINFN